MGWFKNLFVKKISEKKRVHLNELASWIDFKTKPILNDLNEKIAEHYSAIETVQEKIKADINSLDSASYKEKIDQRTLHIVLSNKANYIKQLTHFLEQTSLPLEPDYKKALSWCLFFRSNINAFAKLSVKSYYRAQHLFFDEVEKIAKDLRKLDDIVKKLNKELDKNKEMVNLIEICFTRMNDLEEEEKRKIQIEQRLKEQNKNYLTSEHEKLAIEKEIILFRKSKEYLDLNRKQEDKNNLIKKLKQEQNLLENLFSNLDKALLKFKKITLQNEQIIENYVSSPVKALNNDPELRIIKLLQLLKTLVENGRIELKDKKKEKTLKYLSIINKEYLTAFLETYNQLKENKEAIEKEIENNSIIQKEIHLNSQLNEIKNKLNSFAESITEEQKRLKKIDIDEIKRDIEDKSSRVSGVEVSII